MRTPAHAGSSLADFSTLKMEAIRSSETSVHTRSIRRHIPEDGILHSHRRENLKSYKLLTSLMVVLPYNSTNCGPGSSLISIYINKNVNVRLFKILNLRKFFTNCFEILTQRCIRIRACFYVPILYRCHTCDR
jgi:hypothetical protein